MSEHMIEAAPELLALVRQFEQVAIYEIRKKERAGDDEGAALTTLTLNIIRAAIAKATGA